MTTIRALLFSDTADEVEAASRLAGRVESPQVGRAVVQTVARALEFEVGAVLVDAWRTRSTLLDAARKGGTHRVTLTTYALPWEHAIDLDVRLAGKHLATIPVGLLLEIEVTALIANVNDGLLTHIEGGLYRAAASLTIHGQPIVSRERFFDLTYEIKLGSGILLIREQSPA